MSSISKAPSSNDISSDSIEESDWTTYFEDFFNNQNDNHKCSMSLSGLASSSSLVSNAISLAAKKFGDNEQAEEFSVNKNTSKRPSFKKRKNIMTALVDDALEDTATSPLNSSKVFYANQFENPKQTEEVNLFQEKGNTSGQRDGKKELSFNGRERDSDCTELKKRGLCLVPLSIVVNYLG